MLLLLLLFAVHQLLQVAVVQSCTAASRDSITLWNAVCPHKEVKVTTLYLLAIGSTNWLVEHVTWYTYFVYCRSHLAYKPCVA